MNREMIDRITLAANAGTSFVNEHARAYLARQIVLALAALTHDDLMALLEEQLRAAENKIRDAEALAAALRSFDA